MSIVAVNQNTIPNDKRITAAIFKNVFFELLSLLIRKRRYELLKFRVYTQCVHDASSKLKESCKQLTAACVWLGAQIGARSRNYQSVQ
jgi:hypothetical protein